jgi:hypothetical protein
MTVSRLTNTGSKNEFLLLLIELSPFSGNVSCENECVFCVQVNLINYNVQIVIFGLC